VELTCQLRGYHAIKRKLAAKESPEEVNILEVRRTVALGVTLIATAATAQPKPKRKRSGSSAK
jgi:hypothetical protein